ncbi:class II SORL domain-containing protein [bacterium AH-315-C08]|nr:class II SORL domain-containing protein [bacterium AH-315-C08]
MKIKELSRRTFLEKGLIATAALGAMQLVPSFAFSQTPASKGTSLFDQINRAADSDDLKGLELGHVPQITTPESVPSGKPFEVEVRVGKKLHEMTPAHYIDWIDLYAGEIFLAKFILTPNFSQPVCKVTVTLTKSTKLRAIEHCNLHGLWEGTKQIKVL